MADEGGETQYGRTRDEWNALSTGGRTFLVERARLGRPTSYTEFNVVLSQRTGLRAFDFDRADERAAMGYLLGRIVELDRPSSGLMISALVNYLDENEPGSGFFSFAEEIGLLHRGASDEERLDFWAGQTAALMSFYAE